MRLESFRFFRGVGFCHGVHITAFPQSRISQSRFFRLMHHRNESDAESKEIPRPAFCSPQNIRYHVGPNK